jgi:hypothetical protein
MRTLFAKGQKEAALNVRKRMQKLPSIHPRDPDWRRLKYIRYADDFGLAFTGPKSEAEAIKQAVATFLREELGLKLSEEKTLITHARSQAARFLGYAHYDDAKRTLATARAAIASNDEVSTAKSDDESHEPSLWTNANALSKQENPSIEPNCGSESDFTSISTSQLEYRGLVNYYRHAYTLHRFKSLKQTMEASLTKTLAIKHKTSVGHIYRNYRAPIQVEGTTYRGLRATVEREGKEPLLAIWGGIPLKWEIKASLNDQPRHIWQSRSELEKRLLAQVCEHCGATRMTDQIEVHVRRFGGRDRAHHLVRELMEGSLYTPLTLSSKEDGDHSMWGRPCRGKSPIF